MVCVSLDRPCCHLPYSLPELERRRWLQAIERRAGSPAKALRGALADTGNPDVGACPDDIAETVATRFALTICGRLFHWRHGKLKELSCYRGRFTVNVDSVRWKVDRDKLLNRLFPDRAIEPEGEIDWSTFQRKYLRALSDGYDAKIPGLERDPLRDKEKPRDARVLDRTLSEGEIDAQTDTYLGQKFSRF